MLRMPVELRDRIKYQAEFHNRSMNAEIVAALEEALPPIPENPEIMRMHKLISKFIHNRKEITEAEKAELDALVNQYNRVKKPSAD